MSGTRTVLVIGSGGREHALVKALNASPQVPRIVVAPGNDGMAGEAECRPVAANDPAAVAALAREIDAALVIIGPEEPLVNGVTDALRGDGRLVLGPSGAAAELEGSKAFMKEVARAAGAPIAMSRVFDRAPFALAHLADRGAPIVIKADGLAAGKGVTVAMTLDEANAAVSDCFDGRFGEAGARVLIEDYLEGEEVSAFVLCDGKGGTLWLGDAQDHKRLGDGDAGPNTGGMGAYSPSPRMTPERRTEVMQRIVHPVLAEMDARGCPFNGILFCGLMLTDDGVKLLEFNIRFGDPEAQVLLPRLEGDALALFEAAAKGAIGDADVSLSDDAVLGVVLAAPGYPVSPEKGDAIGGLAEDGTLPDGAAVLCHAGTRRDEGGWRANGGRVLTVVGRGRSLAAARDAAYAGVDAIDWPTAQWRRDIGWRALDGGEADR